MLDVNEHIFRAYDIRGTAEPGSAGDPDLSAELAYRLGALFPELVNAGPGDSFVVGGDNRRSTASLKEAVASGMNSSGFDVVDIGPATSPLLYFTVANGRFAGGVNVTGSHNPPNENGLKFVGRGAMPISSAEIQQLRRWVTQPESPSRNSPLGQRKSMSDALGTYVSAVASLATTLHGRVQGTLRVVVDSGHGVASLVVPQVLRAVGCEVIELYSELDGTFPSRGMDPTKPANLTALMATVIQESADLGFAFDGDGDRLSVVDRGGKMLSPDALVAFFARDFLTRYPGSTVLYDVRCSRGVALDIESHGGIPYMYKSGHSLIKREMVDHGILLGGEGSGHIFFGEDYFGVESAALAAAKIACIVRTLPTSLTEWMSSMPAFVASPEFHIQRPDSLKFETVESFSRLVPPEYRTNRIDGVRLEADAGWALVRASNTNEELIVRAEGVSVDALKTLLRLTSRLLRKADPSASLEEVDLFVDHLGTTSPT